MIIHIDYFPKENNEMQISREWEKEKPPMDYVKVRVRVIQ
jgi:hypothetical protein